MHAYIMSSSVVRLSSAKGRASNRLQMSLSASVWFGLSFLLFFSLVLLFLVLFLEGGV